MERTLAIPSLLNHTIMYPESVTLCLMLKTTELKMDTCHLLLPVDFLQETWIAKYVNLISRVEENPVRADGTLLEECVIAEKEYCVVNLFVKATD